jgi:hypothetical protein
MDTSGFFDVVKYVLPSLVALGFVYMIVKAFIDDESIRRNQEAGRELALEQRKVALPLRLQAYERIIVFLERIHPFSVSAQYAGGRVATGIDQNDSTGI